MRASIEILSCSYTKSDHHVFAINGKEAGYTPKSYIHQICGRSEPWTVIVVELALELRGISVITQICDKLRKQSAVITSFNDLPINLDYASQEDIIHAVNKVMKDSLDSPIFVTFLQVGGGNVDDVISTVRNTFKYFNIIVCTGTEPNSNPILSSDIHMLTPKLDLKIEEKEFACKIQTNFIFDAKQKN